RAECHEEKGERGWVLGRVEKRQERGHRRRPLLGGAYLCLPREAPWPRIPVDVRSTKDEEERDRSETDRQADPVPALRFEREDAAERVACGHDADPRNDRVENDEVGPALAEADRPRKETDVQDLPEPAEAGLSQRRNER